MPTSVKAPTLQQRAVEATSHLQEVLGLSDLKLLSVAVAQAAADEALRNHAFRQQIASLYEELAALKSGQRKRRSSKPADVDLVPLSGVTGVHIDPFAPFDPYAMYKLYGAGQMRTAIAEYPVGTLKEGVSAVQRRHPGTKPKDARKIESLVAYIMEHVSAEIG